ncbi:hypothetical protein Agabi119p4_6715 [Agaricus bisporus var. burnettii]|uniref:Uncharacterized protein n=1 Tax=Agaricus bisporus var. burnettii TaxID=192524 RepID=A0A8H7CA75_AGABI|nr:hypothetical protein Agabi119p4_6715 [Agaricus bisporus var. burnettii]
MPTRQNSLPEVHSTSVQRHGEGMHPYMSLDPFAPSISLQIRNSRRQSTVNSVEDISLPPSLSHRASKRGEDGKTLDGRMRIRSSLESGRSRVGVAMETRTEIQNYGQSSGPLGSAIELETRTRHRRGFSHHNQSTQHEESTFMQETRIPYEYPSINRDNNGSAHHPPGPAADTHQRSNALYSFMTLRHRPGSSDSFLHAPFDEETAEPTTCASSPSKSLRSPRIGGRAALEENSMVRDEIWTFLTDVLPHQAYLHCLLRLPYLYFSRVEQIFDSANLTLEQMKHMALQISVHGGGGDDDDGKVTPEIPKGYSRLKKSWERFIDSLLREWKTLNIISGLLLSGILTIFQIEGTQKDPVTRYMAFWSLISALLSLLYGCIFIIRFSGMRRVYQATEWAIEAQRNQALFWNVWIMLAMPAVWLVWSILAYIACIMSFMWRVHPDIEKPTLGPHTETVFKAFICCVLGIGVLYALLIVNTLRQYGSKMDKSWRTRIAQFRSEQALKTPQTHPLSPVFDMQVVGPTPPQTLHRLTSSLPWQAPRSSPPATANQSSFADLANQPAPFIPPRPPPTLDPRGSSNPPSPRGIFGHFNTHRTFSASPVPMTPEESTPNQSPRNRPLDVAPGTPETRAGTLGLIFDTDGEDPEEAISSSGLGGRPESHMRQRVVDGATTEPNSDSTIVVQAGHSRNGGPADYNEVVEVDRDQSRCQSREDFHPILFTTSHPSS